MSQLFHDVIFSVQMQLWTIRKSKLNESNVCVDLLEEVESVIGDKGGIAQRFISWCLVLW